MHPIDQYIRQLSRKLHDSLKGHEGPDEILRAARKVCGPLHWLASRVSEQVIKERRLSPKQSG